MSKINFKNVRQNSLYGLVLLTFSLQSVSVSANQEQTLLYALNNKQADHLNHKGNVVQQVYENSPQAQAQHEAQQAQLQAWANVVERGRFPCQNGISVEVRPSNRGVGIFDVQVGRTSYWLKVKATSTGAIRLENERFVWLQLGNKSMLMDQARGQRIADGCTSPAQAAVQQYLDQNPQAAQFK